jgi:hypothetical protein
VTVGISRKEDRKCAGIQEVSRNSGMTKKPVAFLFLHSLRDRREDLSRAKPKTRGGVIRVRL